MLSKSDLDVQRTHLWSLQIFLFEIFEGALKTTLNAKGACYVAAQNLRLLHSIYTLAPLLWAGVYRLPVNALSFSMP